MSKFAQTMKSEIARQARQVVRAETAVLRKASSAHRADIAALKRLVATQQKELAALRKVVSKVEKGAAVTADDAVKGRPRRAWTPERIKGLRQRLGLTLEQFGRLAGGYSITTVNKWEHGQAPRRKAQADLNSIYGMGRREARARLA